MQTRFSIISNVIFKYFILFAIGFLWLNFYIDDLLIVGLISFIISIIIGKIISIIQSKKNSLIKISIKEQEQIQNISYQLFLAPSERIVQFYSILLKTNHEIKINKETQSISWQNIVFVPEYSQSTITADTISKIYKSHNDCDKIIIAGIKFSEDATNLAKSISNSSLILLDEQSTFKLFKKYDFYPDFKIIKNKKEKLNYQKLKDIALSKTNTRHYFLSGIIILTTSFFIKYNIYYIVFATLLFTLSGICRFRHYTPPPNILDEI